MPFGDVSNCFQTRIHFMIETEKMDDQGVQKPHARLRQGVKSEVYSNSYIESVVYYNIAHMASKEKSDQSAGASAGIDQAEVQTSVMRIAKKLIDNAVLCYVKNMYGKRSKDLIVQTVSSFYSEAEIEYAKIELLREAESSINDMPNASSIKAKHKASDRKKITDASDILAIIQYMDSKDTLSRLPTYVTSSIFRIPGEDPDATDPKVFQSELKKFRKEVADYNKKISSAVDELKVMTFNQSTTLAEHIAEESARCALTPTPVPPPRSKSPKVEPAPDKRKEAKEETKVKEKRGQESKKEQLQYAAVQDENVVAFYGASSPLSNFYPVTVSVFGKLYTTSEHAYQYCKVNYFNRPELMDKIEAAPTPLEAKRMTNKIEILPRDKADWEKQALNDMYEICLRKVWQNEDVKRNLLATGDRLIVEASLDTFWGVGVKLTDFQVLNTAKHTGRNALGEIWMSLRDLVRQPPIEQIPLTHFTLPNRKLAREPKAARTVLDRFWPGVGRPFDIDQIAAELRREDDHLDSRPTSFADAAKQHGPWRLATHLKCKNVKRIQGSNKEMEGLVGVKRERYTDFYVGPFKDSATEAAVTDHLKENSIDAVHCFAMPSKIKNSTAFRVRVLNADVDKIKDAQLWPEHVSIRPWVRKPKQKGNGVEPGNW